jgi:hypothetical protein
MFDFSVTTPNRKAVEKLTSGTGESTVQFLNTWITTSSKVEEKLEGCDDETKAVVMSMVKVKADGYMTRNLQQMMMGNYSTTFSNEVTTNNAYIEVEEVCNRIITVLDSSDDAKRQVQVGSYPCPTIEHQQRLCVCRFVRE